MTCETCKDLGETYPDPHPLTAPGFAVNCPDCGRPTYPNLGVNLPAGAVWAFSAARAVEFSRAMEAAGKLPTVLTSYADARVRAFQGQETPMLVLSFKDGEGAWVGPDIHVKVTEIVRGRVRLGFDAPRDLPILRDALLPPGARPDAANTVKSFLPPALTLKVGEWAYTAGGRTKVFRHVREPGVTSRCVNCGHGVNDLQDAEAHECPLTPGAASATPPQ